MKYRSGFLLPTAMWLLWLVVALGAALAFGTLFLWREVTAEREIFARACVLQEMLEELKYEYTTGTLPKSGTKSVARNGTQYMVTVTVTKQEKEGIPVYVCEVAVGDAAQTDSTRLWLPSFHE